MVSKPGFPNAETAYPLSDTAMYKVVNQLSGDAPKNIISRILRKSRKSENSNMFIYMDYGEEEALARSMNHRVRVSFYFIPTARHSNICLFVTTHYLIMLNQPIIIFTPQTARRNYLHRDLHQSVVMSFEMEHKAKELRQR